MLENKIEFGILLCYLLVGYQTEIKQKPPLTIHYHRVEKRLSGKLNVQNNDIMISL